VGSEDVTSAGKSFRSTTQLRNLRDEKLQGKGSLGKSRHRREDIIETDCEGVEWIKWLWIGSKNAGLFGHSNEPMGWMEKKVCLTAKQLSHYQGKACNMEYKIVNILKTNYLYVQTGLWKLLFNVHYTGLHDMT
jgi:hypothetical protein